MTTRPGFSSRSSEHTYAQYPQRDEAQMNDDEMHAPGFSNSAPVEEAPADVAPDVAAPDELEPGFSNGKAVKADAETKVVAESDVEDKAVAKKAVAKKTAAKKG